MIRHEISIASKPSELEAAFRVRHSVFVEEIRAMQPGADTDGLERTADDAHAIHLVARVGAGIVGTVRIQEPSPARPAGRPVLGLVGEDHYDYAPLAATRVMEIARSAVLPAYRDAKVIADLWKAVILYGRRHGVEHFTSLVQVGYTDSLADARLVYDTLARQRWLHPRVTLAPRTAAASPMPPRHPLFSAADRAADLVHVPAAFVLFRRFGLLAAGPPVFMPEIGRIGMVALAGADTFPAAALRFFDEPAPHIHLEPGGS